LFFTANDGVHGRALWKSDGTKAGTVMVKDIDPRPQDETDYGYGPTGLTALGGTLFFSANDGPHGRELWKSNGTKGGTVLVKDIYRGRGFSLPAYLTPVDGRLFFLADNTRGMELWKSNGTKAGTVPGQARGARWRQPRLRLRADGLDSFGREAALL
jgi:ELWxxDGT repeat protein